MLILSLVLGGLAVLILVSRIVQAGPRRFDANHRLREIDIPAFRNLLSRDDEHFLRRSLTAAHYRKARRARLRAEQEYLVWIAENCAVLLSLLRSGEEEKSSAEQPLDIALLAKDALRLRLIAVGFWFLLWIEYLLPNLQIRPLHTIKKYEELWRTVEIHLAAIVPQSTVVANHGRA